MGQSAVVLTADTDDSILDRQAMCDALTSTATSSGEPTASEQGKQWWTPVIQVCEARMGEAKRAKELGITRAPITRVRMRTIPVPVVLDDQVTNLHHAYAANERAQGNDDPHSVADFMCGLMRLGIAKLLENAEPKPAEPAITADEATVTV